MDSSTPCSSNPMVGLCGGVAEFEVEVGRDDESLRGSKHFIPETDFRREYVESDLFMPLIFLFGEDSEYIVELIEGRDLCRGIVRLLSLWRGAGG